MPDFFAEDIPSALTMLEARAIRDLAAGRLALEVGSQLGRSTVALASSAEKVHSVDWHRGDPHAGKGETLPGFLENLRRHGVRDRVVAHVGRAQDILPVMREQAFDLAFIDGFHTEQETLEYIRLATVLVKPGGVIAFHDYHVPHRPDFGVKAAVDRRFSQRIVNLVDSMAIVQVAGAPSADAVIAR